MCAWGAGRMAQWLSPGGGAQRTLKYLSGGQETGNRMQTPVHEYVRCLAEGSYTTEKEGAA